MDYPFVWKQKKETEMTENTKKRIDWLYYIIPILCFTPLLSSPLALGLGIIMAFAFGSSSPYKKDKLTKYMLQASIVLMGFGMNLSQVIETSKTGFYFTAISVTLTLVSGLIIGHILKVEKKTTILISGGTAICGGSAIAALSSIINPKNYQLTFSLTVIFVLNAVALFLFPFIGHAVGLSQETFGTWAAIAIHDTSSVVGAASSYGPKALEIATTIKLTRALWVIPVSLAVAMFNKESGQAKISIPWFIGIFVLAILVRYLVPGWEETFTHLNWLGKKGMLIALFLIGASINKADIVKAGLKPFLLGVSLWLVISVTSFYVLTM